MPWESTFREANCGVPPCQGVFAWALKSQTFIKLSFLLIWHLDLFVYKMKFEHIVNIIICCGIVLPRLWFVI